MPHYELPVLASLNGTENINTIHPDTDVKKLTLFYDVEVYPNLFCVTFKTFERTTVYTFTIWYDPVTGEFINEVGEMIHFLMTKVLRLIGYNNKGYDDLLLAYILTKQEVLGKANASVITNGCQRLSDTIINLQTSNKTVEEIKKIKQDLRYLQQNYYYRSLDVMLLFNTGDRVSLKQIAINIRWPNIVDLPISPHTIVKKDQIDMVLEYNLNDVLITEAVLTKHRVKEFRTRVALSAKYELDLYDSCDTVIAKKIIAKYYCQQTGMGVKEFMNGRTFYQHIDLKNCISPKIKLFTKEGLRLLTAMRKTRINPNIRNEIERESQFKFIYTSKYVTHTIGLGGIHSMNPAEIMQESDEFFYYDFDATSFYPAIMVNENLYPQHLGKAFIDIYRDFIMIPRIEAKRSGDKVAADGLKITANGTYGLTKSVFDPLYDPLVTTRVCINGQLYLISLIELIETYTNAVIVYSNTDGITVKIPIKEYNYVMRIVKHWQDHTGFNMESVRIRKMVIRDINNYINFTYDKEKPIKAIGHFAVNKPINKGYSYPIVAIALKEFYDKGTKVEDTITNCTDVYQFIKAVRTNTVKFVVEHINVHTGSRMELQKSNRWIVTKGNQYEGRLQKISYKTGSITGMEKGHFVTIVNNIPENSSMTPTSASIDYTFYIGECYRTINTIRYRPKETHVKKVQQLTMAF